MTRNSHWHHYMNKPHSTRCRSETLAPGYYTSRGFLLILAHREQSLGRIEQSVTKYRLNFVQRFSINQNSSTMKTKTLLMVCLLLGIGLTQLSAQNGKNGNGVISLWRVWDGYWQPVYCDGVNVDNLTGTVIYHVAVHYKNGNLILENVHYSGVVQSSNTTEEFKMSEVDKVNNIKGILSWHFNLIGNQGTHYVGTITWDMVNDPNFESPVIDKAICH